MGRGSADFAPGTRFTRVYGEVDAIAKDNNVKRLIFVSGKLYYDLLEARREAAAEMSNRARSIPAVAGASREPITSRRRS